MSEHDDGGANAARFLPPGYGGQNVSDFRNASALRGGINNNFVPSFSGTASTLSTGDSINNGGSGQMSGTAPHMSTPGTSHGLDGAFDSDYISRRPDSRLGNSALRNDNNGGNQGGLPHYQATQGRSGTSPRRDSFGSNGTFATQLPNSAYCPPPSRQEFNSRQPNNMPRQTAQYPYGGGPQLRNGIEANVNGISAGIGNIRIADTGSPLRFSHPYNNNMGNKPYLNGYNGGPAGPDYAGMSSRPEGRSKYLANAILQGQTEDPYDRTLSRYDTPSRLPNPTLGPARFKDSKVFATIGDMGPNSATDPLAMQAPMRAIVPAQKKKRPDWLDLAIQNLMKPTLDEAFDALPLAELARTKLNNQAGVIRIKGIPYGTTRQEMTAFIGRNAQVLRQPEGAPYHAVHILMERESGKTMDCFIEVTSPAEAAWVARQFARRVEQKRPPKVGDRVVEVLYSSQDELMVELFPRAKHVRWSNGQPVVDRSERKYYADRPAAGFQGFLHPEELVAIGKHASLSERSPFASKSPCRVYESMITLLYKYPWHSVDEITIAERRGIYDCAIGLIKTLITDLRRANNKFSPLQPTPALLQELSAATLVCPGFTEKQKASIVGMLIQGGFKSMADGRDLSIQLGGQHEFSALWPFSALGIPADADQDVVQYFAHLFRQATSSPQSTSLAARKAAQFSPQQQSPMGNWNIDYGQNASALSLAQVGKIEFDAIERILKIVCAQQPPAHNHPVAHSAPGSMGRGGGSGTGSSGSGPSRQSSGYTNYTYY